MNAITDLDLAFQLADLADAETMQRWSSNGVAAVTKPDGSPVTEADQAAEEAVLACVEVERPGDAFLGEEVGERPGTTGRRWILDGIDSTKSFAAGLRTWGILIALEADGEIVLGVASSPAQYRRWWAMRGSGAFSWSTTGKSNPTRLHVSPPRPLRPELMVTLPAIADMGDAHREALIALAGGSPIDRAWCQQIRVADGEVDVCVWTAGDIWDHAAPSILVEEAGGQFSDFEGGRRLDTRRAIYSNGVAHQQVLAALTKL